jgi:hypothetical protein
VSEERAGRFVVLGLAGPRSPWFRDVGRWATGAAVPMDFIRCVSLDEVAARLDDGGVYSAVLIDSGVLGLDRDVLDLARGNGVATLVVDDGRHQRDWIALGATAVLPGDLGRSELMDELVRHGRTIERTAMAGAGAGNDTLTWSGRLVAVTGGSGAGTSTLAMALAQGFATDTRHGGSVLLADLALRADLAMYHDARDVVPGLQEMVEAHRTGVPSPTELRRLVFDTDERGYHLLLGLRRHRDWAVLRPRTVETTIANLLSGYRRVICDVECDLEGHDEVGALEVEERNQLARLAVAHADVVVAVGTPDLKGLHGLLRVLAELTDHGVAAERIVTLCNRAGRPGRKRAEISAAFADLVAPISHDIAPPVFVPYRRNLDATIRDGIALPSQMVGPITAAVNAALERNPERRGHAGPEPVAVAPGSLGHFAEEDPT